MPTPTIKLYQFMPRPTDVPQISSSPFCAKVEAYLILTGRPYETAAGVPPLAPTKTVPYVTYGKIKIGDSQAIIEHLEAEAGEAGTSSPHPKLEAGLTDAQQTISSEVLDLVENRLYFSLVYSRFASDEAWAHQIDETKWTLPFFLRWGLPGVIRREQVEKVAHHGCGTEEEAYRDVGGAIERLAEILGTKPFLLGDQPTVADCSLFGFLAIAKATPNHNPLTEAVVGSAPLMNFLERMTKRLDK